MFRIYGEEALSNLKKAKETPTENQTIEIDLDEYIELKSTVTSQEKEILYLKKQLSEQTSLLQEIKERETHAIKRSDLMFEEMQISRRLLEGKTKRAWFWQKVG